MKGIGHRQKPKFKGKSGRSRYTRGMHLHDREPFNMIKSNGGNPKTYETFGDRPTLGSIWPQKRVKVDWFMEYDGGRADVLWLWEGWAPCLDAWKAMSCCSRGRLVS